MKIDDVRSRSAEALAAYDPHSLATLDLVANHVSSFLAHPHPDLGRSGNVCPYIPESMARGLCRLTLVKAADENAIETAMASVCDVFRQMEPSSVGVDISKPGDFIFKAIIVVFPNVAVADAPSIIGGVQRKLKPKYVQAGMMIGEFYPDCGTGGLHNADFRPLVMPVPAIAIRHVTKYDAPFMVGDQRYIDSYVTFFGDEAKQRLEILAGDRQR